MVIYALSQGQWEELKEYEPFQKAIKAKVSELGATGVTFRMKAGVAAEHLLEVLAGKALDQDASYNQQMDAFKVFSKAAGTDSPPENAEKLSAKFTINISLGAHNVQITAQANQEKVIEVEDVVESELGAVPVYFLGKDLLLVEVEA